MYRSVPFRGLAAAGLAALGLHVSFRYSLAAWGPDPDTTVPVLFWQGLMRHGPAFVPTWTYTPDNWLLSLLPLTSALFSLTGAPPLLVCAIGWIVFVACVGMTAWLARRIGGWGAAAGVAVVLLFANADTLGRTAYLAAPVTHNISMAWGLAAMILAVRALQRGSRGAAVLAGLFVLIDCVSDPWARPAIAGPLILAGALLAWLHRRTPAGRAAAVLALSCVVAAIGAQTRLFGLLPFLSISTLVFASPAQMAVNALAAVHSLTAMGQLVPGAHLADPGPRRLCQALLFVPLLGSAALAVLGLRRAPADRQLVVGTALLSIAAVSVAFVVFRWPSLDGVARWFHNAYVFAPLLVVAAVAGAPADWRPRLSLAAVALGALFAASGLASAPRLWTGPFVHPSGERALTIAQLLEGQGLRYGYGPYWGAQAPTVTWLSGGRVTIRPVSYDKGAIHQREAETSSLWYQPGDEPKDSPERFLIVRNDGETCPDLPACIDLAERQFGPPSRVLQYQDMVILVWPHPISDRLQTWDARGIPRVRVPTSAPSSAAVPASPPGIPSAG